MKKVTVWESAKQLKTVFESDATTLKELKSDMRKHGINYENCDMLEGVSHTALLTDETVLPHDTLYKGKTTNDLMIFITARDKKISSGASSRKEIMQAIKEAGLKDAVQKGEGKNYTQVKTEVLEGYLKKNGVSSASVVPVKAEVSEKEVSVGPGRYTGVSADNAIADLDKRVSVLEDVMNERLGINPISKKPVPEEGFHQDEMNEMFNGFHKEDKEEEEEEEEEE